MKYPLSRVRLVNSDKKVLENYRQLQKYIKEELNCLEIELSDNEDEFIVYKAEGENRMMGQAFGKKFDKKVKAAIQSLSSDQVRTYIREGKVEVMGLPVTTGMLVISKSFKDEFTKSKQWAVASNMKSSVMLDIVQTDQLKAIGIAREITNRIQRLRKTSGISIDDQIEIFYTLKGEKAGGISEVLAKYADKVMAQTRMPFMNTKELQGTPVMIG
jgi:isoleucyl-tRNA synthetase